jgi:2-polyprenyl-3-methyl-5-hydroxy-6-metoxy-1,4-benzoquinol methylase
MKDFEEVLDLGKIPFHIGLKNKPSNGNYPDVLPFVVGIRKDVGLLIQLPDDSVKKYLEEVYAQGLVIGTPMDDKSFGLKYADDFLEFLSSCIDRDSIRSSTVLEIGCGNGYLLSQLKEKGARILGIEPGQQAITGANKFGVEIIRDVFPSTQIENKKFDIITHYCVLEHITDPDDFLNVHLKHLKENGKIIAAVPDCSEYIRDAEISIFTHEHYSYFTANSLNKLFEKNGFSVERTAKAKYGGCLYFMASIEKTKPNTTEEHINPNFTGDFGERAIKNIKKMSTFLDSAQQKNKTLGIFVPARIINYLTIIQPKKIPRLFDDDKRLYGLYYPPIHTPIESRSDLLKSPVDELLIMSRSFGKNLKSELEKNTELKSTRILTPEDIFRKDGFK